MEREGNSKARGSTLVVRPQPRGGLAEDVAFYIRELILTGAIKPNSHIDQEAIGEALGVSRSPVREAIVVLGQEGLLEVLPRRGAQVANITRADVIDHYELFGLVSGRAAEIAAESISEGDLVVLREIHDAFEPAGVADMSALNGEFHRIINRLAPQRTRWLLGLLERTVPSRYYEFAGGWDAHAVTHHAEILGALLARDGKAARQAMEHHLHESGVAAADALSAQGFWSDGTDADATDTRTKGDQLDQDALVQNNPDRESTTA